MMTLSSQLSSKRGSTDGQSDSVYWTFFIDKFIDCVIILVYSQGHPSSRCQVQFVWGTSSQFVAAIHHEYLAFSA